MFGRRHVMAHMKDFLGKYPAIRLEAMLTETTVDLIEVGAGLPCASELSSIRHWLPESSRRLSVESSPQALAT